jgi:Outer membrane protein beta-barrel domain
MRFLVSILLFSTACFAQFPLSFGIKGGVPLTDSFQQGGESRMFSYNVDVYSASKNYIVGPMVQLWLPFHLAVEADALYRPLNVTEYTSTPVGAMTYQTTSVSGNYGSWEFPVVAMYRFSFPIVKPYLEAGPSFRTASAQPLSRLSSDGATVGAGVDFHLLMLHIAPEFRYTHWSRDSAATAATEFVTSYENQVEFLVGLTF